MRRNSIRRSSNRYSRPPNYTPFILVLELVFC